MASCCPFNIEAETAVLLPLKWSFYIPELPFHPPWEPPCSPVRGSTVEWEKNGLWCQTNKPGFNSIPSINWLCNLGQAYFNLPELGRYLGLLNGDKTTCLVGLL